MYEGALKAIASTNWVLLAMLYLFFCTPYGLIAYIAHKTAGLNFTAAYSGSPGELFLTGIVLLGISVIQRGVPSGWFPGFWSQIALGVFAVAIALYLFVSKTGPWTWPDAYFAIFTLSINIFVLPLMVLAIINGKNQIEIIAGIILLAAFAYCVYLDLDEDPNRLNQPRWIQYHYGNRLNKDGEFIKIR